MVTSYISPQRNWHTVSFSTCQVHFLQWQCTLLFFCLYLSLDSFCCMTVHYIGRRSTLTVGALVSSMRPPQWHLYNCCCTGGCCAISQPEIISPMELPQSKAALISSPLPLLYYLSVTSWLLPDYIVIKTSKRLILSLPLFVWTRSHRPPLLQCQKWRSANSGMLWNVLWVPKVTFVISFMRTGFQIPNNISKNIRKYSKNSKTLYFLHLIWKYSHLTIFLHWHCPWSPWEISVCMPWCQGSFALLQFCLLNGMCPSHSIEYLHISQKATPPSLLSRFLVTTRKLLFCW